MPIGLKVFVVEYSLCPVTVARYIEVNELDIPLAEWNMLLIFGIRVAMWRHDD